MDYSTCYLLMYRMSGIFRLGLIFAEFATSLKSPKIDTAKNKSYYKSPLRTLQIAKIGLSENLTHLPGVILPNFPDAKKFPIYSILRIQTPDLVRLCEAVRRASEMADNENHRMAAARVIRIAGNQILQLATSLREEELSKSATQYVSFKIITSDAHEALLVTKS